MTSEVPYTRIFNRDPERVARSVPDAMLPIARDKAASELDIRRRRGRTGAGLTRADFGTGFDQVARGSDVASLKALLRGMFSIMVEQETDETNITDTTFVTGAATISTTFTAPASGKVEIIPYFRANPDTITPPIFALYGYQIYEGVDASGTLWLDVQNNDCAAIMFDTSSGNNSTSLNVNHHSGLTPGKTYFVRGMHRVGSGTTIDITYRRLIIKGLIY